MAVSSEFILAPRIDEKKMRQESEKMQVQLRRASKQAADDFEYWFGKGFERAADKGTTKLKSNMTKLQGFLMLTGANLASEALMAAGAVAKDFATKAIQGAEEYTQLAKQRLNNLSDMSDTADALGINRGRYAALSAAGISARLDQSDIQGILSGFVGALERPEMALYKDAAEKNGIENALLDFIGTMSKMDSETSAQYMNQVFGDSDALKASRFMRPFKEILADKGELTFKNIMDAMFGGDLRIEALDEALNRNDDPARILAKGEADALVQEILDGITKGQAGAVVASEASESNRIQAHIEALELKVKGKIIADDAEIAAVKVGYSVIDSSLTYSAGIVNRWEELVEAGNQSATDLGAWKGFAKKLLEFGKYSPVEAATGKGTLDHVTDYMDRKGAAINSWMVEIAEKENQANKNRRDVGPLK